MKIKMNLDTRGYPCAGVVRMSEAKFARTHTFLSQGNVVGVRVFEPVIAGPIPAGRDGVAPTVGQPNAVPSSRVVRGGSDP
ncbi:hypothetical protein EV191_12122 [Tamaricihabitans halophyticus]|uniref:Uncharacterized protein n=1 Tax=Tamaricihabitans halophyticus TaxID=1262583 RepID=A0A4R2QA05_9PSEU|nr:hypothetical protein EV191_12122 [Tamaricihabitans halophyticus]